MAVQLMVIHNGVQTPATDGNFSACPDDELALIIRGEAPARIEIRRKDWGNPVEYAPINPSDVLVFGVVRDYAPCLYVTTRPKVGKAERAIWQIELNDCTPQPTPPVPPVDHSLTPPPPVMPDHRDDRIKELEQQIAAAEAERDQAREAAKAAQEAAKAAQEAQAKAEAAQHEAEEKLRIANLADPLTSDIKSLQAAVKQLESERDTLKKKKYNLDEFTLPDLRSKCDALTAEEDALKQQERDADTALQPLREQSKQREAERVNLNKECEDLQAAITELKARHTDLEREQQELIELRKAKGMHDEDRIRLENEAAAAEKARKTAQAAAEHATAEKRKAEENKNKAEAEEIAVRAQVTMLTEQLEDLKNEKIDAEAKCAEMQRISSKFTKEWEDEVRKYSILLSDMLRRQLDVRRTYEILTLSLSSDLVAEKKAEAEAYHKKLNKCGELLGEISRWVGGLKDDQMNGTN